MEKMISVVIPVYNGEKFVKAKKAYYNDMHPKSQTLLGCIFLMGKANAITHTKEFNPLIYPLFLTSYCTVALAFFAFWRYKNLKGEDMFVPKYISEIFLTTT